jgi:transcriptional antiterminator NusG
MRWYVIKAMSGREDRCLEVLANRVKMSPKAAQMGELLIPVERVTELKRGRKVTSRRKLYPGYIYGEFEMDDALRELVTSVDGITGFLGDRNHPVPLSSEEADRILAIARAVDTDEQRAAIVQVPYSLGDKVKVREGTFAGMEGLIEEINPSKGILKVSITVFGRQTPIELEVWQVEGLA